jgi:hypothetical protein
MPRPAQRLFRIGSASLVAALMLANLLSGSRSLAQQPASPPPAPTALATAPSGTSASAGWDEVDQRLVFLTVELSGVETSLNAVDKAIHISGHQQAVKQQQAENYRKGNELMDRNAGGPVPWNQFYGRTAQSFFYHPTRRSVYINPGPIPQRPPQLDYIYRANSENQQRAEAEAAAMGDQVDQLLARRRQLEREQEALWCKIALRALASRELMRKPLYAFEPTATGGKGDAAQRRQRVATLAAGCDFMRAIDRAAQQAGDAVDRDPTTAFEHLEHTTASARDRLSTELLRQPLLLKESQDSESPLARFSKSAGQMEDCALNIRDAARLADQSDKPDEEFRRQDLRGQVQQNLIKFAETALVADQELTNLAAGWEIARDPARLISRAPETEQPTASTAEKGTEERVSHSNVDDKSGASKRVSPPAPPSSELAGIELKNPAHAPEAEQIVAELRAKYPDAIKAAKGLTLVHYHDATELKRHFGGPAQLAGSYSGQPVAGSGRNIMLFGASDDLPPAHYLIVYRVQALTPVPPSAEENVCFLDVCIRGKTAAGVRPKPSEFQPNHWSDIPVVGNLRKSRILEYRLWSDGHKIALDRIYVFRLEGP